MSETVQRIARPTGNAEPESNSPSSNIVIRRNTLTLYISFTAIILSVASAGVNLWTFYAAGQRKMQNEADQIQLAAGANRVLQTLDGDPKSHPELRSALDKLYKTLLYRPPSDAKLTVYERVAFGLVVQNYAIPMANVQQQTVEGRMKLGSMFIDGKIINWGQMRCIADPFGPGCGGEAGVAQRPDEK